MALALLSESFKDGERLGTPHVLSEAYGFGCAAGIYRRSCHGAGHRPRLKVFQ